MQNLLNNENQPRSCSDSASVQTVDIDPVCDILPLPPISSSLSLPLSLPLSLTHSLHTRRTFFSKIKAIKSLNFITSKMVSLSLSHFPFSQIRNRHRFCFLREGRWDHFQPPSGVRNLLKDHLSIRTIFFANLQLDDNERDHNGTSVSFLLSLSHSLTLSLSHSLISFLSR